MRLVRLLKGREKKGEKTIGYMWVYIVKHK